MESVMNALDLARWQFAITTVYHFLFVPITIGLGFLVAGLQTAWYRKNNLKYLRATKFFGKLFLINFAIGVVTAGVPVRNELVNILTICRRYLRSPTSNGRLTCLLP